MTLNRRTFAATSIASAAALTAAPQAFAQATPVATPGGDDVIQRLRKVMDTYGVPGAVIGITTKDSAEPQFIELGVADVTTNAPMTADMHMRIASVTKTFVSTVVLQLVDEGALTLDDTIAVHLPDLDIVNADVITVRHLLSMQSGLPHIEQNPDFLNALVADNTREYTREELIGYAAELPATTDPGTTFDYNNLNYNVLDAIIEKVSGESWHANLQQRILDPLNMTNTSVPTDASLPQPHPAGYGYVIQETPAGTPGATPESETQAMAEASPAALSATPVDPYAVVPVAPDGLFDLTKFHPSVAGAAGDMVSTVGDLLLWAPTLGSAELVSPEMHEERLKGLPLSEDGQGTYGLGLLVADGMMGHNGAINGFQSAVITLPEAGVNIAVLTNCHPVLGMGDAAFELVFALLG